MVGRAVAHVLWFGGNHTELNCGGELITVGPTDAIRMWPMWSRKIHCRPSGTKH